MWQTPQSQPERQPKQVLKKSKKDLKSRRSLGLRSMSALGHFAAVSHSRLVPSGFNPYYDYLLVHCPTFIASTLSLAYPEDGGSYG